VNTTLELLRQTSVNLV